MATTYTTNARLRKPGPTDRGWDVPINANADALDALTALGALATTAADPAIAPRSVRISAGAYVKLDGTVGQFAGEAARVVPASSTTCLWIGADGNLVAGDAFPASAHVRLARVDADAATVVRVVDQRVQCSAAGSGLGFVLKAGDTVAGPFAVATAATGTAVFAVDASARAVGFFGAAPATQAPALASLADNSSGVAVEAIANAGPSYSQAQLNANFASLTAKVNALIAALRRHGLMAG